MWLTHLSPLLQFAYKFMRWGEKFIFLGGRKPNATFPLSHVSENQKWECGVSFSILTLLSLIRPEYIFNKLKTRWENIFTACFDLRCDYIIFGKY